MNAGDRATSSTSCSRGWALRATVLPAGGGESSIAWSSSGAPRGLVGGVRSGPGRPTLEGSRKIFQMSSATCNEGCPCWGKPTDRPRLCPICDHLFRGNGWDGIDRHYRTQHEKQTGESYEDWWNRICQQHKG